MSFKFRPHRGGLKESMKEIIELDTLDALRAHVDDEGATVRLYDPLPDVRVGWNKTCIVLSCDGFPLGFTDDLP